MATLIDGHRIKKLDMALRACKIQAAANVYSSYMLNAMIVILKKYI